MPVRLYGTIWPSWPVASFSRIMDVWCCAFSRSWHSGPLPFGASVFGLDKVAEKSDFLLGKLTSSRHL